MSQNQPNDGKKHVVPLDSELVKNFLENQKIDLKNKQIDQQIRIKELEANTKLAQQSMEMQERYMNNSGPDFRKTITTIAYIAGSFLVIILFFIGMCLYLNKDTFAYKFCQGISYLISLFVGGVIGRKTAPRQDGKSKSEEDIQTFE